MIKLTAHQITALASAIANADGFLARPENTKPSSAAKVATKLIEAALVREVRAKDDAPIWREDDKGRTYSLKILKAGRVLIAERADPAPEAVIDPPRLNKSGKSSVPLASGQSTPVEVSAPLTKGKTKRGLILALMGRKGGASIDELIAATDWLPHTTRAALSGLRKSGYQLDRTKRRDGASAYHVTEDTLSTAG